MIAQTADAAGLRFFVYKEVTMPDPGSFDNEQEFMKVCIPKVLEDGTAEDNDQAVAVCMQMWKDQEKSVQLKIGARNASKDLERLQQIHDLSTLNGANCPDPTKWPQPKALIFDGSEVKALGGGKVGGYLIRFSTVDAPDLEGDYFTKDTDFGEHDYAPVYYQHGLDEKMGKRKIGKGKIKPDDIGQWIEAQLDLRDEYEKYIYKLAEDGKLGWSSGTASHLVEREQKGNASWIKSWPLGLDASLTPTPAEPRNTAIPIKSLPLEVEAEDMENVAETMPVKSTILENPVKGQGDITMEQEELIKILDLRDAAKAKEAEETAKRDAELKAAEEAGYKKAIEENKFAKRARFTTPKVTTLGFKDDDVKTFLYWTQTGDEIAAKAALSEANDSEGGFWVPEEFANSIIAKRNEISVTGQIGVTRVTTGSDIYHFPTEGTAATKFVVANEEAAYDENEPTAAQTAVTIHKLTKLIKISEEFEEDAIGGFGAYLASVWARAMAAADNYYHVATGTGGGEPQSMIVGGALLYTTAAAGAITAAEFIKALFSYPDQYADGAVLICKRDVLGYLRGLLVATPFAFLPQNSNEIGSGNAKSHGSIFGFPVYCTAAMTGLTGGVPVTACKHVLMVNPGFYGIVERSGMTVSRNPYLYQASGQIGLFAKYRQGAAVLQSEAVTYLLQA